MLLLETSVVGAPRQLSPTISYNGLETLRDVLTPDFFASWRPNFLPFVRSRVKAVCFSGIQERANPITLPFWSCSIKCQTLETNRTRGRHLILKLPLPEESEEVLLRLIDRERSSVCSPWVLPL